MEQKEHAIIEWQTGENGEWEFVAHFDITDSGLAEGLRSLRVKQPIPFFEQLTPGSRGLIRRSNEDRLPMTMGIFMVSNVMNANNNPEVRNAKRVAVFNAILSTMVDLSGTNTAVRLLYWQIETD